MEASIHELLNLTKEFEYFALSLPTYNMDKIIDTKKTSFDTHHLLKQVQEWDTEIKQQLPSIMNMIEQNQTKDQTLNTFVNSESTSRSWREWIGTIFGI